MLIGQRSTRGYTTFVLQRLENPFMAVRDIGTSAIRNQTTHIIDALTESFQAASVFKTSRSSSPQFPVHVNERLLRSPAATMKYVSIPIEKLQLWTQLNDVTLHGVKVSSNVVSEDGTSKGGGLLSTTTHTSEDVLLSIPQDLILSKESVLQCSKTDGHLRQLVEVMEDFIQVGLIKVSLSLLY